MSGFNEQIHAYGNWRSGIAEVLARFADWLEGQGIAEPVQRDRLASLQRRLENDRTVVAFVAEFSRGKSELINALFLADYGQRVLPSGAGRTTMCPTELMYDPTQPPGIRLLPIETRLRDESLSDLRERPQEWLSVPFDPNDVDSVRAAFECVRETRRITLEQALLMGLCEGSPTAAPLGRGADDLIEVSAWRHAIANLPHPLLRRGLVVVDTPGLNALGAEPELTLNLLPSAHAVVFVLTADAGVSRTDLEVWKEQISPTHSSGRFALLNKIDSLWDPLRSPAEIDAEIATQAAIVASTLGLAPERVFPVSAQQAMVAKVTGDEPLLVRSRLPVFERALSREIVPRRQTLMSEQVRLEFDALCTAIHGLLGARKRSQAEQLFELEALRGRNRQAVEQTARRIREERADFEAGQIRLKALRSVLARHEAKIRAVVGIDRLKGHVQETRERMRDSRLSLGLKEGMESLLAAARHDFYSLTHESGEVHALMAAMYARLGQENGLALGVPAPFPTQRFFRELDRIAGYRQRHFGARSLVLTEKWELTRRFLESVAVRLRALYELALRSAQVWLQSLMAPIDAQVREHELQFRQRLDAVQRILDAGGELKTRIEELRAERARIDRQLETLGEFADALAASLEMPVAQRLEPATF